MRSRTGRSLIAAVVVAAVIATTTALVAVSGNTTVAQWSAAPGSSTDSAAPSPGTSGTAPLTTSPARSAAPSASFSCAPKTGWDCDQQRRFTAASAFLARKSGKLAIIVHDRTTDTVWRSGTTTNTTWTASTIKLAIVATVLEWGRAGKITIDAADRANMNAALVSSSNDAATALWARYGGQPMFDRFRSTYGMASLSVVPGYDLFWRNLRCSAEDLFHLMDYVLASTNLDDRAYLVDRLRSVASNQQWGVWAAGTPLRPGNKNGWAQKPDTGGSHWVTHSVGFAGPSERYVVVVTYSLPTSGTMSEGIHAVSDLVATVFGAPVPARVSTP